MANNLVDFLFSKSLSATDVNERLHWPSRYPNLLPFDGNDQHADFTIKGLDGGLWRLRCSRRATGYAKHVISSGWMDFVHNKGGLRQGDELIVYRNDDLNEALFVFSVKRKVSLFGRNINQEEE